MPILNKKNTKKHSFCAFLPFKLHKEPINRRILRLFAAKFYKSDRLLAELWRALLRGKKYYRCHLSSRKDRQNRESAQYRSPTETVGGGGRNEEDKEITKEADDAER